MYFEQFYLTCLAHASYMIGSEGEAAVVDPQRDVDIYLKAAAEQNLTIRHIFETHLHADFVSGHRELAARTGAKIYIGAQANAGFPHEPLTDGFDVKMGAVRIRALETPARSFWAFFGGGSIPLPSRRIICYGAEVLRLRFS